VLLNNNRDGFDGDGLLLGLLQILLLRVKMSRLVERIELVLMDELRIWGFIGFLFLALPSEVDFLRWLVFT